MPPDEIMHAIHQRTQMRIGTQNVAVGYGRLLVIRFPPVAAAPRIGVVARNCVPSASMVA
jgi:hypothetical protein